MLACRQTRQCRNGYWAAAHRPSYRYPRPVVSVALSRISTWPRNVRAEPSLTHPRQVPRRAALRFKLCIWFSARLPVSQSDSLSQTNCTTSHALAVRARRPCISSSRGGRTQRLSKAYLLERVFSSASGISQLTLPQADRTVQSRLRPGPAKNRSRNRSQSQSLAMASSAISTQQENVRVASP